MSSAVSCGDKMSSADKQLPEMATEGLLRGINVKISLQSVVSHLDFLQEVDKEYQLTEGAVLNRAIDRYHRYWLPLAAKHSHDALPAPLDIEWVWHCHMLSPVAYEKDCLLLVGAVVPHRLLSSSDRRNRLLKSENVWNKAYPGVPFNVDLKHQTEDTEAPSGSKISYDLVEASFRQKVFYYHVSLSHYRSTKFLENSLERYRKFLYLLESFPGSFLAPSYDIDLMWHTHQLDPVQYKADTLSVLGKHLNHDDTVSDRSEDSKLTRADKLTRLFWKKVFNENFARPGAMYRGESTRGKLHDLTEEKLRSLVNNVSSAKLHITELQLDRLPQKVRIAKLKIGLWKNKPRGGKEIDVEMIHSKNWIDKKQMLWKNPNLFNGRVDVEASPFANFALNGISGYSMFKKKFYIGTATLDCLTLLHNMQGDGISFNESIKILCSPIQLMIKGTMSDPKPGSITLKFNAGDFEPKTTSPMDRKEIWGPVPLPPPKTVHLSETCYVATHKVSYMNNTPVFRCKVVHSTELMTSAVYVYHNDKLIACAHVIGSEQLPEYSAPSSLSLNPKIGERAILIKNNAGDWGMVSGHWTGVKKGVRGTKGTRHKRGKKGTPGSYGYLTLSFLDIKSQKIECSDSRIKSESFRISIGDIICYENRVTIARNHQEAAEYVALAFSVGILHVLCQPRSPSWKPGLSPIRLYPVPGLTLPPAEDVTLLAAAGIMTYCACNHVLKDIYKARREGTEQLSKSNEDDADDSYGSGGDDSTSVGCDSAGFSDDFMETGGMDSGDIHCEDIGVGSFCGAGGGGCGGGCGGGGSTCGGGGGGSSCGGGGSSCGGGGGCGGGCGGGGD